MSRLGLQTMETIHEPAHKTLEMPKLLPEAALFSVSKPTRLKTETVVISGAVNDGLFGRSSSMKMPLTRKASFRVREWVKRSSSTRTTRTSGLPTPGSLKAPIKHLGGGRLEKDVAGEGSTTSNTIALAPTPRRAQKSRASSMDSRVTQWLDFYTEPPEPARSQSRPLPAPLPTVPPPSRHQRPGLHAGRSSDLRPAPLRVPSSERGSLDDGPPSALVRKDSSSKPLPRLPTQPTQAGAGTAVVGKGRPEREQNHEPATRSRSPPNFSESSDLGFLPFLRFGTPPLTPDSTAGGAARTRYGRDMGKEKEEDGATPAKPKVDDDATLSVAGQKTETRSKAETADSAQHTRRERVWLHINYRGESPFLQAWGMDISKPIDRVEGLALLRELIQAEREREGVEGVEGTQTAVQGNR